MRRGTATILVVDDDPSIRLLCRVNLELDGFRVLEAATVGEARERLEADEIDVVLLDRHLGPGDGHALVSELRDREAPTRIALLTGSSEIEPAVRDQVDALLTKPFSLEALRETVRRLAADDVDVDSHICR